MTDTEDKLKYTYIPKYIFRWFLLIFIVGLSAGFSGVVIAKILAEHQIYLPHFVTRVVGWVIVFPIFWILYRKSKSFKSFFGIEK